MEECLELVSRDRDRGFGVISPLISLPAETDLVLQEGHGKGNPDGSRGSSSSQIVLTLLIVVIAIHMGLFAIYVREIGLQLLPGYLGNDRSRSENGSESGNGSGSRNKSESGNKSGSKNRSLSLQNSLKNPL